MNCVILSCPTLKKELQWALSANHCNHPVCFLPQRLHSSPKELCEYLQNMIDSFYNVDRIMLCVSSCGGGTIGLKASCAEIVLPKTRDCIDILLSGERLSQLKRPKNAIFLTESWMEFMKNSSLDLEKQIEKSGEAAAKEYLQKVYKGFENFYMIDTGTYDTQKVKTYILPLVEILHGNLHTIKGNFNILHKMTSGRIDDDFILIPKGKEVSKHILHNGLT